MTVIESTIRVVAPATLNEGYNFDVTTDDDGRTLTVTVPSGGVTEGQTFDAIIVADEPSSAPSAPSLRKLGDPENPVVVMPVMIDDGDDPLIPPATSPSYSGTEAPTVPLVSASCDGAPEAIPAVIPLSNSRINKTIVNNPDGSKTITEETTYPDGRITKTVTNVPAGAAAVSQQPQQSAANGPACNNFAVPTGAWRHDLFSCCDTCTSGMFWMSWCCTYIALGQLLQRMKMNICGQPAVGDGYKTTCQIWTIVWAALFIFYWIIVGLTNGYGVFIYTVLFILALVAMTNVRYFMRTRYIIPADCCADSGCLSDCCCVYWCTCCSIIQMMRHTHNEEVYYYNCGSSTGLEMGVPEVV